MSEPLVKRYSMENTATVIPFNQDGGINSECDKLAFMHSGAYAEILGVKQRDARKHDLYGYLKLKSHKNTIYLRYRAWNHVNKKEVMLSYINRCRLGLVGAKSDAKVKITKSCWFAYYWYNGDSGIRYPFIIAFFSLLFSIVGILLSIFL